MLFDVFMAWTDATKHMDKFVLRAKCAAISGPSVPHLNRKCACVCVSHPVSKGFYSFSCSRGVRLDTPT